MVFVVDDDKFLRAAVRAVLEEDGRTVEDFESCEAFLAGLKPGRDACLLIDASLPGMSGLDLLPVVKQRRPDLPVFMISAYGDRETVSAALARGAEKFLTKPVDFPALKQDVSHAVTVARNGA